MAQVTPEFSPSLSHPFYFVRRGLLEGIQARSKQLKGKLLDFGCGSKPYKALFEVEEYIGVDFENEGHTHENEQIDFYYNGKELPFNNEQFDSVLCSEVFEHIFNIDEVLGELNRVMKTGGKIMVTCPFVWNEHEVPHDFARYTVFALQHLLSKHGFRVMEVAKTGNFVKAISQLIVLYFYSTFYRRTGKFFLTRWLYKFLFVVTPNFFGLLFSRILPDNNTLYLNNIIVAVKERSN